MSDIDSPIMNLESYCISLINTAYNSYLKKCVEDYKDEIICIHTPSISSMNFNLDNKTKNILYNCGIDASNNFIIRKILKKKYFNLFKKNTKKNHIKEDKK